MPLEGIGNPLIAKALAGVLKKVSFALLSLKFIVDVSASIWHPVAIMSLAAWSR